MYYLQSRYYNPTVGRFLNADIYCDTQSSILGTNMFAYCLNNPIIHYDINGYLTATETIAIVIQEIFVCLSLEKLSKALDIDFSFSTFDEYKTARKNILYKANKRGLLSDLSSVSGLLSSVLGCFETRTATSASNWLGWTSYGLSIASTLTNNTLTTSGKLQMMYVDTFIATASLITVSAVVTGGMSIVPICLTIAGVSVGSYFIHAYFEKEAYNSHFDLGW